MALINIPNYNRIINIKFFTKDGQEIPNTAISCPTRGRKPKIELTGTFYTTDELPAFNVTIKNLYMDIPSEQYPQIQIEAGYEGRLQTFTGSIITMYQEGPGPESNTVIQCTMGNLVKILSVNFNFKFEKGYKLTDVLSQLASSLDMQLETSSSVQAMTGEAPLEIAGKAQDVFSKLRSLYSDKGLKITVRGKELHAYTTNDTTGVNVTELKFLSAPPQQNAGSNGTVYATINAPWEPELRTGDLLTFPSWQYMKNYGKDTSEKTSIFVNSIQFHFGTTGSTNEMTVQGRAV